jgi:hypothetical protein
MLMLISTGLRLIEANDGKFFNLYDLQAHKRVIAADVCRPNLKLESYQIEHYLNRRLDVVINAQNWYLGQPRFPINYGPYLLKFTDAGQFVGVVVDSGKTSDACEWRKIDLPLSALKFPSSCLTDVTLFRTFMNNPSAVGPLVIEFSLVWEGLNDYLRDGKVKSMLSGAPTVFAPIESSTRPYVQKALEVIREASTKAKFDREQNEVLEVSQRVIDCFRKTMQDIQDQLKTPLVEDYTPWTTTTGVVYSVATEADSKKLVRLRIAASTDGPNKLKYPPEVDVVDLDTSWRMDTNSSSGKPVAAPEVVGGTAALHVIEALVKAGVDLELVN